MGRNLLKPNSFRKEDQDLINKINSFEDNLKTLSDNELRARNFKLQKECQKNQNLDPLIAESFALTREASLRTLGLRHFDVQLIGGFVLNRQKIAEMKTGEGKTLVATLPACLNALTGKGVHIVTVNNYLASRDQVSMGQIYKFLGFDTGLIQDEMLRVERKKNYNADITYLTNYNLAFDYLRDNLAPDLENVVLRAFNYCILDEVDSILIDEAQTPLIIADSLETSVDKYMIASEIAKYLEPKIHYQVDEKNKNIVLTEEGGRQIEKILQIQNLYDLNDPWISHVINAIKANAFFYNNVHYIIQNNRAIIVDEFTGRIMGDRRWGEGLHQAIEAKENLPVRKNSEITAAITYQNFFLLYPKLSGMTGTGKTAEIEFEKIYNLSVDEIPTARPNLRKDLPDLIYKDQFSKWNAVAQACNKISSTGQPVLIGTTSIQKSEMLAQLLNEYKLPYQLLNAKPENVRREAEIVAQAGKKSAITIATNMAGRGTDIILGGNIKFQIQKELYAILTLSKNYIILSKKRNILESFLKYQLNSNSQKFLSVLFSLLTDKIFLKLSDIDILKILQENDSISLPDTRYKCSIKFLIDELVIYYRKHQEQENKIVKNLGGLYIIGTERNDSRRVDNQLRGRCGRQGDPGISRFFLSLDDNLLRVFGGPKVRTFLQNQMFDDSPLESRFLTKSLDSAQQRVEERAYQQRKNLFDYDNILNEQRKIIYFERRQILESSLNKKRLLLLALGEQVITDLLVELNQEKPSELNFQIIQLLEKLFVKNLSLNYSQTSNWLMNRSNLPDFKIYLFHEYWLKYQLKDKKDTVKGDRVCEEHIRKIILISIDKIWRAHLQEMTLLRESVGWRGYGQQNPLYEYKREAFLMFELCSEILRHLVVFNLLRSVLL